MYFCKDTYIVEVDRQALFGMVLQSLFFIVKAYFALNALKVARVLFCAVRDHIVRRPLDLSAYRDKWTVVTGCTDGIGLAYTEELARARGLRRFFLIGRSPEKLAVVAGALQNTWNCDVKTLVFDLESTDFEALEQGLEPVKDNVGILVNCAGIAAEGPGPFLEQPPGMASKIVQVDLVAPVRLMELLLPSMCAREGEWGDSTENGGAGIVVNVSSMAGWRPVSTTSAYAAAKAGLRFFSSALVGEMRRHGVRVQCLTPLLVSTKIRWTLENWRDNVVAMDTRAYARQAVRVIGYRGTQTGCFQHDLQVALMELLGPAVTVPLFMHLLKAKVARQRREEQPPAPEKLEPGKQELPAEGEGKDHKE